MNIGTWLQSLGLEQYEQVFRENAISSELLPALTEGRHDAWGAGLG